MKRQGHYTPTPVREAAHSIRAKTRSGSGFSITELLLCCVILLLCTSLIVDVFTLSMRQFRARTRESAARMLCNTLSLAIQNELAYVNKVVEQDADSRLVSFQSGAYPEYSTAVSRFVCRRSDADKTGQDGSVIALSAAADSDAAELFRAVDTDAAEGRIYLNVAEEDWLPLADGADYGGGGRTDTLKARCLILVKDGGFQVTVTVTSADPSVVIRGAENTFFVTPVKPLTDSETGGTVSPVRLASPPSPAAP